MDRPRSPVKDAGRVGAVHSAAWVVIAGRAKHEERGRLPAFGRDDPAR